MRSDVAASLGPARLQDSKLWFVVCPVLDRGQIPSRRRATQSTYLLPSLSLLGGRCPFPNAALDNPWGSRMAYREVPPMAQGPSFWASELVHDNDERVYDCLS